MTQVYVYNIKGELIGVEDINALAASFAPNSDSKAINNVVRKLKSALNGDKGYGYFKGSFVSYKPITLMTKAQQKTLLDNYLTKRYEHFKAKYQRSIDWDEDLLQDTVIYLYNEVSKDRGVNNIDAVFEFKYNMAVRDKYGRNKKSISKLTTPDFEVYDEEEEGEGPMFTTLATQSMTMYDEEDQCLQQVNELRMLDHIREELYQHLPQKKVDIFLAYTCDFVRVPNKGKKECAKHFGISVRTLFNYIKEVRTFLDKNKSLMMKGLDLYPTIDEITLKNIIYDGNV